jgi:hypothetical protein
MTTDSSQPRFDLDEFPVAIESPYFVGTLLDRSAINLPIELYNGPAELRAPDHVANGTSKLRVDWLPVPHVYFEFWFPGVWIPTYVVQPVQLRLIEREITVDAFVTSFEARAMADAVAPPQTIQKGTLLTGTVVPTTVGSAAQLASVTFHLPNFFARNGTMIRNADSSRAWGGRLQYAFGEWEITLDRLPERDGGFGQRLAQEGGYSVGHVGRARRADNKLFAAPDVLEMFEAMDLLLSFCNGRRTGALLPLGFDAAGNQVWELWSAVDVAGACPVFGWVPDIGRFWTEALANVFSRFADRWARPDAKDTLRTAVDWYVEANSRPPGREKEAIVMTQAALELLAWAELVEHRRVLSASTLDRMPAADKLRLLIDASKTPLDVPVGYSGLQHGRRARGKPRWRDAPDAFTNIRNSIIHAGPKGDLWNNCDWPHWLADAKQIGLWYLERSILHFLGYEGWYKARGVVAPGYGPTEQWFPFGLPPGMVWASDVEAKPKPDSPKPELSPEDSAFERKRGQ